MKLNRLILSQSLLCAALVLVPAAMLAQTAPTAPVTGKSIAERKADQQQRIAQGVRSGQLTRSETRHLETRERAINREERALRATNDGHLTQADKRILTRQQNATSKQIYNKKHNGKTR